MAARVATDLTLHDLNPTGKEIGRGAYGRVFIYLFIVTGQTAIADAPRGRSTPQRNHTYT